MTRPAALSPSINRLLALVIALGSALSCAREPREVVLASTTSTEDSGLFEVLIPAFQSAHPEYRIRVIALGSGEALRLAARGDADVVLTHSPRAEEEFMEAGHGLERRRVMYNDFVIVGPPNGTAEHCAGDDAPSALRCIAEARAAFVSRGDDSGTHARERRLWTTARVRPEGDWYLEAGQGMGAVLMMASEKGAYTLTDRGTFLSLRDRLRLVVLAEGDEELRNQYTVTTVRGAAVPDGAGAFAEWIVSDDAQRLIGEFGVERFGRPLFTPNAALD